jgi:hypothetical protein
LVDALKLDSDIRDPWLLIEQVVLRAWTDADRAEVKSSSARETFCVEPRFTWGDFEAISYCWESDVKGCDLILNGEMIKVPRNLEAALQKVRQLAEVRSGMKIWCDALCVYSYRTAMKHLKNLRFMPQFSEGFNLSRSGKTHAPCFRDKIIYAPKNVGM